MKVKGWEIIYWVSGNWNPPGVYILIPDKVDFKPKLFRRDKKKLTVHIYNFLKYSIPFEQKWRRYKDCKFVFTSFIKQTLIDIKRKIGPYTIIVDNLDTPFHQYIRHPHTQTHTKKLNKFHQRSNGFNRHLHNITSKCCKI
jgi:hypothetical protein